MADVALHIRCQRCGAQMDLRDPAPGTPWQPNQFWVCPKCSRHYWTTYPSQPGAAPAAAPPSAAAAKAPAVPPAAAPPAPKPAATAE